MIRHGALTPDTLSDVMEFDHVIRVLPGGSVVDAPAALYAPNVYDGDVEGDRWALLGGHSGQQGYPGPMMHSSETISGGLARRILFEPGFYVAVVGYSTEPDTEPETWAVARYIGPHRWTTSHFTGSVTCYLCGLLPLDADDEETTCQ